MKACRTLDGLLKAIAKGEKASLKVYGGIGRVTSNIPVEGETVYLNRGEGRFIGCSYETFLQIKDHLVVI